MPHFRYYTNNAPFPGTCVYSGENRDLWEVGTMTVQGQVLPVLLSSRVLQELAVKSGFVTSEAYAQLNSALTEKIRTLEAQNEAVPNLLKELQNDFSNLVSNFVIQLASVTVPSEPVQPESAEASTGGPDSISGSSPKGGKRKVQATKPSTDSTVD